MGNSQIFLNPFIHTFPFGVVERSTAKISNKDYVQFSVTSADGVAFISYQTAESGYINAFFSLRLPDGSFTEVKHVEASFNHVLVKNSISPPTGCYLDGYRLEKLFGVQWNQFRISANNVAVFLPQHLTHPFLDASLSRISTTMSERTINTAWSFGGFTLSLFKEGEHLIIKASTTSGFSATANYEEWKVFIEDTNPAEKNAIDEKLKITNQDGSSFIDAPSVDHFYSALYRHCSALVPTSVLPNENVVTTASSRFSNAKAKILDRLSSGFTFDSSNNAVIRSSSLEKALERLKYYDRVLRIAEWPRQKKPESELMLDKFFTKEVLRDLKKIQRLPIISSLIKGPRLMKNFIEDGEENPCGDSNVFREIQPYTVLAKNYEEYGRNSASGVTFASRSFSETYRVYKFMSQSPKRIIGCNVVPAHAEFGRVFPTIDQIILTSRKPLRTSMVQELKSALSSSDVVAGIEVKNLSDWHDFLVSLPDFFRSKLSSSLRSSWVSYHIPASSSSSRPVLKTEVMSHPFFPLLIHPFEGGLAISSDRPYVVVMKYTLRSVDPERRGRGYVTQSIILRDELNFKSGFYEQNINVPLNEVNRFSNPVAYIQRRNAAIDISQPLSVNHFFTHLYDGPGEMKNAKGIDGQNAIRSDLINSMRQLTDRVFSAAEPETLPEYPQIPRKTIDNIPLRLSAIEALNTFKTSAEASKNIPLAKNHMEKFRNMFNRSVNNFSCFGVYSSMGGSSEITTTAAKLSTLLASDFTLVENQLSQWCDSSGVVAKNFAWREYLDVKQLVEESEPAFLPTLKAAEEAAISSCKKLYDGGKGLTSNVFISGVERIVSGYVNQCNMEFVPIFVAALKKNTLTDEFLNAFEKHMVPVYQIALAGDSDIFSKNTRASLVFDTAYSFHQSLSSRRSPLIEGFEELRCSDYVEEFSSFANQLRSISDKTRQGCIDAFKDPFEIISTKAGYKAFSEDMPQSYFTERKFWKFAVNDLQDVDEVDGFYWIARMCRNTEAVQSISSTSVTVKNVFFYCFNDSTLSSKKSWIVPKYREQKFDKDLATIQQFQNDLLYCSNERFRVMTISRFSELSKMYKLDFKGDGKLEAPLPYKRLQSVDESFSLSREFILKLWRLMGVFNASSKVDVDFLKTNGVNVDFVSDLAVLQELKLFSPGNPDTSLIYTQSKRLEELDYIMKFKAVDDALSTITDFTASNYCKTFTDALLSLNIPLYEIPDMFRSQNDLILAGFNSLSDAAQKIHTQVPENLDIAQKIEFLNTELLNTNNLLKTLEEQSELRVDLSNSMRLYSTVASENYIKEGWKRSNAALSHVNKIQILIEKHKIDSKVNLDEVEFQNRVKSNTVIHSRLITSKHLQIDNLLLEKYQTLLYVLTSFKNDLHSKLDALLREKAHDDAKKQKDETERKRLEEEIRKKDVALSCVKSANELSKVSDALMQYHMKLNQVSSSHLTSSSLADAFNVISPFTDSQSLQKLEESYNMFATQCSNIDPVYISELDRVASVPASTLIPTLKQTAVHSLAALSSSVSSLKMTNDDFVDLNLSLQHVVDRSPQMIMEVLQNGYRAPYTSFISQKLSGMLSEMTSRIQSHYKFRGEIPESAAACEYDPLLNADFDINSLSSSDSLMDLDLSVSFEELSDTMRFINNFQPLPSRDFLLPGDEEAAEKLESLAAVKEYLVSSRQVHLDQYNEKLKLATSILTETGVEVKDALDEQKRKIMDNHARTVAEQFVKFKSHWSATRTADEIHLSQVIHNVERLTFFFDVEATSTSKISNYLYIVMKRVFERVHTLTEFAAVQVSMATLMKSMVRQMEMMQTDSLKPEQFDDLTARFSSLKREMTAISDTLTAIEKMFDECFTNPIVLFEGEKDSHLGQAVAKFDVLGLVPTIQVAISPLKSERKKLMIAKELINIERSSMMTIFDSFDAVQNAVSMARVVAAEQAAKEAAAAEEKAKNQSSWSQIPWWYWVCVGWLGVFLFFCMIAVVYFVFSYATKGKGYNEKFVVPNAIKKRDDLEAPTALDNELELIMATSPGARKCLI
eukprot:GDKJ01050790.1.p1 GENE.GDKJ01050790.1~~GDKJ01050790.1.p1  ORF type:complete len:2088 (+),score=512.33 GDKJ01050790.1:153-6266(+)